MSVFFLIISKIIFIQAFAADTCEPDQHWVKAHHRRAYYRANGTFVKATYVTAHCQGNPVGYKYWEPKLKNNRPSKWPYRNEKTKKWTDEERERTIEAMGELPEILWGNSIEGIFRMDKSQTFDGNPATSAEGIIVLYDTAFSQNYTLAQVIAHELAHEKYRKLDFKDLDEYQTVASWAPLKKIPGKKQTWITSRTKFVRADSMDSPEEDFANNVEYFLFNPMKLKSVTPNTYDWIKRHFGDKLKLRTWSPDAKN